MLPPEVVFGGVWEEYLETIYGIYLAEIVHGRLTFEGMPVKCRFHPATGGKGFGFWHCISTGNTEEDRIPDFERCRRIRWIAWTIGNAGKDRGISWWEETRGRETDVLLFIEKEKYLVVLSKRRDYLLLKTAYVADKPHKLKQLQQSRSRYERRTKN